MSSKEFKAGHNEKNLSRGTSGNESIPGNIARNMRNPTGSYRMRFAAGSSFEIRVSHLLKAFCVWVVVVVIAGLFLHSRIRSLEMDRNDLERKVDLLNKRIEILSDRIEILMDGPKTNYGDKGNEGEPEVTRRKRSADQSSLNNKNTAPTDPGSKPYELSSPVKKSSKNEENFNKEVNPTFSSSPPSVKMIRQIIRKETKKFKTATRLQMKALNRTIRNLQERQNQSFTSSEVAPQKTGGQAAYLQLDRLSLNIQKKKQLIGPWYLPEEGKEIGFGNADWYNNLTLDSDGTSIIFEEAGLFLIYAQIFYQLQPHPNDHPNPMGYRIYLKRSISGRENSSGKPVAIAECVPSFPSTLFQTCFTQVAWFMEAKDEIYVEHFTESKPIIEASKMGQTFVGIVKLS